MSALDDLAKQLQQDKQTGSDYIGTVTRVEDGTAYVQLTGADIMDTPVVRTIDCKPGDKVRVRVSGGKAWITGNDTAPPTNDTASINQIHQQLSESNEMVDALQVDVEKVTRIAGNTNQYFWHTETGEDTGAHITEVTQDEWNDPGGVNYHSGGNLLARSNGIAVREGLTELASFGATGAVIGTSNSFRTIISSGSIELIEKNGATGFQIGHDGNTTTRTITRNYKITSNSDTYTNDSVIISIPAGAILLDTPMTFRAVIEGTTYTATKSPSEIDDTGFTFGSTNRYIWVHRGKYDESNIIYAEAMEYSPSYRFTASLSMSYQISYEMAKINFTGGNNILWSGSGIFMREDQYVNLSEPISAQLSGAVLAWSGYANGSAQNYDWFYNFVPKDHVFDRDGAGVSTGIMTTGAGGTMGIKYVYVSNEQIRGYSTNDDNTTGNGITLKNNHWVLRYVLGV